MSDIFSLDNPSFRNLAFYSAVCTIKTLGMAHLTGFQRRKKQVAAAPEDINMFFKDKTNPATCDITRGSPDPDVERVRRNHLNDLENIPFFILIGLLYLHTRPDPKVALWHFRLFTGARILYTLAYTIPLPQPSRALTFFTGFGATCSMLYQVLKATY